MKKGLFLIFDDLKNNTGVNRKIKSQMDSFRKSGIEIEPYLLRFEKTVPGYRFLYRLPFSNLSPVWEIDPEPVKDLDFLYMRRPFFCNFWFLRFLKKIKAVNPKIKILYEIPTYPYDSEIKKSKKNLSIYVKDRIARKHLHKYIDRICILSGETEIFGVPTIPIRNGYDFEKISLRKCSAKDDRIHLAIVALFDVWHGYERLLYGLSNYQKEGGREFVLHFIGDGPELPNYKKIAHELGVAKNCVFYGMQTMEQMERIYDACSIGVSSLGLYKIGIFYSCELKSREYLAKGLPILCCEKTDLMEVEELRQYLVPFPNNGEPIDFAEIERFYSDLYADKGETDIEKMAKTIRSIAEKEFNMESAMSHVVAYLNAQETLS